MTWEYPTRADLKARHGNINFDSFIEPVATPDNPVVNLQQEDTPSYEVVWEPIPGTSQEMAITSPANHILYCGARGPGKFQPLDEPVLTPRGWKTMGDMKRGSRVLTPTGHQAAVTHVYPHPNKEVFLLTFDDGSSTRAGGEHLWKFKATGYKRKAIADNNWHIDDTNEMKRRLDLGQHVLIPTINPARLQKHPRLKELPADPYLLGLWLGDGHVTTAKRQYDPISAVGITSTDDEITQYIKDFGFIKRDHQHHPLAKKNDVSKFYTALRDLKLKFCKSDTKFVPPIYLRGTVEVRTAILQGLMDSDGTCDPKGYCSFTSTSKQLAIDVQYLAWSLGAKATLTGPHESTLNGQRHKDHYDVYIQPAGKFTPFRLGRKLSRIQPYMHKELTRRVVSIVSVGKVDCACIQLDDLEHLYITKDFIVTHNTITQLMRYRARVGIGYGQFWRGIIFDREFKNLKDLVAQSNRFFPQFEDGAKWHSSASEYKWVWPSGEELMLCHVKKLAQYEDYHGWEIPFLGWNELTKYPDANLYNKFMSINRSSFRPEKNTPKDENGRYMTHNGLMLPPIPLEVFSTTNSSGPGHAWVKKRFVTPAKYGEILKRTVKLEDTVKKETREVTRTQCCIFGSFYENTYLSDEYKAEIFLMTETNPNLRKSWIEGSWDVTAGGAIDDLWMHHIHVVDRFVVPKEWKVNRTFDWGSSHPAATVWWAEANGEEVKLLNGKTWCPARGSLIAIADDYTCQLDSNGRPDYTVNLGLRLDATQLALRIAEIDNELIDGEWVKREIQAGPADNQISDTRESDVETIEEKMAKQGVRWTKSDKSPGSRVNGLDLMRTRLHAAIKKEGPAIYFMRNCRACIETLPPLPRDDEKIEDVDTDAIDHLWDAVRYRVLQGSNHWATKIKTSFPR